jgi:polar amino acid transport system permease protein
VDLVWIFRSIPLIVLLLILNNLGYLYETMSLGVPFTDITFFSYPTTQLISPFAAGAAGPDAQPGGLLLRDHPRRHPVGRPGPARSGRRAGPAALGARPSASCCRRRCAILPTAFNDIIGLAKGTSMVYILALPELFYTIQIIYRRNLEVIPLLMVATVWYLSS